MYVFLHPVQRETKLLAAMAMCMFWYVDMEAKRGHNTKK